VEGAGEYEAVIYQHQDSDDSDRRVESGIRSGQSIDVTRWMESSGAGKYRCMVVRALSYDIEAIANGAVGEFSDYYDTTASADSIGGIISGAMGNAATGEALETVKSEIDKTALRTAMQTDDTVLDQIRKLESAYTAEQGITVPPMQRAAPLRMKVLGFTVKMHTNRKGHAVWRQLSQDFRAREHENTAR